MNIRRVLTLFLAIGNLVIVDFLEFHSIQSSLGSITAIALLYFIVFSYNSTISNFFGIILKKFEQIHDLKEEINQILENLEESIMILSDDLKADFINQRFLYSFSKEILDKVSEPQNQEVKQNKPSILVKLKKYLRKISISKISTGETEEEPVFPEIMKVPLFKIH